ncbi:MAG: glucuronate isomerase [Deltaproteobacteria bacterium]|nr:glucuronate isomerase [Deltaproteobacteria bacterium]
MAILNDNRLFPAEERTREIARSLYNQIKSLPIISPHGHTDPAWYAENINFEDPAALFIIPDHYLVRMLCSQGYTHASLGVKPLDNTPYEKDPRKIWDIFAKNYHLFLGTPTRLWIDYVLSEIFEIEEELDEGSAESIYNIIDSKLKTKEFRIRNLYKRFGIEVISTTDEPNSALTHHKKIRDEWDGRVIPCFRPDSIIDPLHESFINEVDKLCRNNTTYTNYLDAIQERRLFFKEMGAVSTDHGCLEPYTAELSNKQMQGLFDKAMKGQINHGEAREFQGHMLMEMARMSIEDGLVMQIHPGVYRNHSSFVFKRFGRDKGVDIPVETEYVKALRPLLERYGHEKDLKIILFTLDDTRYTRELAPLAGYYPVLRLGPAWWFNDSPEGMMRFRESVTETAGFYNTVGFNDDTRAFLSIPARHDMARRVDASYLARLVAEHRLSMKQAERVAIDLAYNLPKESYNL